jgi:Fic family protein
MANDSHHFRTAEETGMSPFQPRFTISNSIAAGLTRIERARGFLEAATLSEAWVRAMGERALVLEAHHTTHIEGTRLTLEQAERLWAEETVPEADPEDARELLNYRRAFEFVSAYLESGGPITQGLIREIHKHLVEGVRGGAAAPGEYRKTQNYVLNSRTGEVVYTPPPAHDVPILMAELVAWLNHSGEVHPVLVSGIVQFQLVHIHPFLGGNGRTRGCSPRAACTGPGTTSSGCSPSTNTTTATALPCTRRSRESGNRAWT